MKNMTPEDMKRAAEEMKNMTPEQMKQQMEFATKQAQNEQKYKHAASNQLKKDGNALVGEGKYADAIEKYERVRENMKAYRDPEAQTLKKSCLLNSALCMNKVGRHEEAIERCEEVLKMENTSLKAYYRRGQGYFQLKNLELAWKDLKRAVKLSPEDEIVRGELEKCEEEMEKLGMVIEIKCPELDTFEKEEGEGLVDGAVENVGEERMSSGTEAATSAAFPQMGGMGGMSPDMMQQAAEMMKDMSPETMEAMMSMAADMQGGGIGPDGMPTADVMKKMQDKMGDPKMQKAMAEMMSKVNPEQIKQMSKAAGVNMSDEQAEQAAQTLKNVKPETMEKFMKLAAFGSKFYGRFKTQIDWMNRNRKLTLTIFVVMFAAFVQQVIRWWRRPKSAIKEVMTGEKVPEEEEAFEDAQSTW
jgi:tetratricopeptide (TPR) repeat protein